MGEHARVVVIGAGVVCLYHLTELGWTDAVLLEQNELTSGSTWHAAGNRPTFTTPCANVTWESRPQQFSVNMPPSAFENPFDQKKRTGFDAHPDHEQGRFFAAFWVVCQEL